ncbi:hypothetical protein M5C96_16500 [Acidovorax sp. GBBC 1281]|nr:hypothetical protein M5C96_13405 [Acidovorax sp. GBBC 1281]WCM96049.1 hypothetical protein M5C96_16500 [Acidovorax sp. GBBC 1281]
MQQSLREAQLTGQFAFVEVNAAGNASTLNPDNPLDYLNGYVVWPQMGFDGPIPANRKADLHPCEMVSDVLKSVDGKSKWATYGDYWEPLKTHPVPC